MHSTLCCTAGHNLRMNLRKFRTLWVVSLDVLFVRKHGTPAIL